MSFISYLINGISLGSVYALIALGYTMVYGIAKMLNFAHGDVIMVGAFITYTMCSTMGLSPVIGVLAAVIACTLLGMAIEKVAYKPLRKASSPLAVLITAIGVSYLLQNGLFAVLLAPAINMFPALGEEVGWRGYMMPRLKEQFGLLNGRLLGGVVWGIWHWPLMLLVGYEYGTDYLGAPLLGLVVWCVVCFALNTLLDVLYEKTESIWVPAIAHGAFNAIAALPQVLVTPTDAYYNVLGPMPIGLIAALPMLAAAVWLTLREMKQEEKN